MKTDKKSSWKEARKAERDRQLVMLAIPIVLILLIIIIVVADRPDKEKTEPVMTVTATPSDAANTPDAVTENNEETPEETEEAETKTPEPSHLQKDEVPEINKLMEAYYDARVNCNAEKLSQLYGKPETDVVKLEATRKQLLLYARYIRSADRITCYTAQLENQNVWFVIMTADIHFRPTDTVVPTGQQFFVKKDEEGNFLLINPEEVTKEQQAFGEEISMFDEARLLALDINTKMKDAIDSDPELANIYGTLNSGSPIWENGEPETEPQVQILTQ